MVTVTAEKAFVVLEAIWDLENALWELFYEEFLTLCEEKSTEKSTQLQKKNGINR